MTKTRSIGLVVCALLFIATSSAQQQDPTTEAHRVKDVPKFARVNDRLYRGGQPVKDGIQQLAALGVNSIINLRDEDENSSTEADEAKSAGLRYFNVPFKRFGRPTDEAVNRVLSLIDSKDNGIVFIHCHKGEDRTGMIIALYRINHDGWTDHEAIQEAKHFGMKFWQAQMRDYISDYYRDKTQSKISRHKE
jgi:protein tyrosine/serine phosphatase